MVVLSSINGRHNVRLSISYSSYGRLAQWLSCLVLMVDTMVDFSISYSSYGRLAQGLSCLVFMVDYSYTKWCQIGNKTGTTSSSIDSPLTINLHQYPVYRISNHPNSTSLG